jgi:hypothetical protein
MIAMNETKSPTPTPSLSKPSQTKPTTQKNPNPLETFMAQTSFLEKALLDALQPHIQNKQILTPTRYQTLLNEARCHMTMQAQQSDVLTKGAALLAQKQELSRFLNMQRTLLIGV